HLCSHKSAGHKKDNERCALEGFLFIVQHPLQVRQSLRSKVGNPVSAAKRQELHGIVPLVELELL
ncbi:MAG: hypothetical protein ACPGYN_05190, partial [Schleiferiaceae bacterium]